jgi:predicted SAM-dependent methyltransferase
MRLHIGGLEQKDGWKILNIEAGENVDLVGDCLDLHFLEDNSVLEIYASHVAEHLQYCDELPRALKEFLRVLVPGGRLMLSVPDLDILCRMFVDPKLTTRDRFVVMRFMFGGQTSMYDLHKTGFSEDLAYDFLSGAGFKRFRRVADFGLFQDTSIMRVWGTPISLNIECFKP